MHHPTLQILAILNVYVKKNDNALWKKIKVAIKENLFL